MIIKGLTNILSVDFNKDLKIFPWGKIVFSTSSVERTAHTYERKKEPESCAINKNEL